MPWEKHLLCWRLSQRCRSFSSKNGSAYKKSSTIGTKNEATTTRRGARLARYHSSSLRGIGLAKMTLQTRGAYSGRSFGMQVDKEAS
eukprot:1045275-Amphidinium_carterae.2